MFITATNTTNHWWFQNATHV